MRRHPAAPLLAVAALALGVLTTVAPSVTAAATGPTAPPTVSDPHCAPGSPDPDHHTCGIEWPDP
ncbi:hypothetical protein LX15_005991 [Streptoalloteichus tenebrarius]|uniref:Secreted protein n=1 Tax=Streptoalloteichus tenebrarius (strain ATCC 17920 / DSM 40477 / JCM 4838 / CBS 697.72 / NBRC 16177 / NCIMB 11028 / NRRL B-12390 / A12253. 1 / ISP 5477) TaxID=1933 RepID=A0ABT1I390_STRSD|nr:hypothetical protein [Streptoalloteichus tenebrarius]MCP2262257.1 hypothetical protein [Streptoalloteichus tenebrarius]BFF00763.1 hypothetical protein GCM10020241_24380 [Streptoalloteichus tenebrarius]